MIQYFRFRQVYFVLKRKELGQPLSGPSRSNHKSYCDEMFLLPPLDPGCSVLVHNDGSCTLLHAARAMQAILLLLPLPGFVHTGLNLDSYVFARCFLDLVLGNSAFFCITLIDSVFKDNIFVQFQAAFSSTLILNGSGCAAGDFWLIFICLCTV